MQLYGSRLKEVEAERGKYSSADAYKDIQLLNDVTVDTIQEPAYLNARPPIISNTSPRWNTKGRELEELTAHWYDHGNYFNLCRGLIYQARKHRVA